MWLVVVHRKRLQGLPRTGLCHAPGLLHRVFKPPPKGSVQTCHSQSFNVPELS